MKKLIIVFLIIFGIVVIVFVVNRPSYSDFKNFAAEPDSRREKVILVKVRSEFFASYFEKRYYTLDAARREWSLNSTIKYKGFFNNFQRIK